MRRKSLSVIWNANSSVTVKNGELAISFLTVQSLLMALICPSHALGYFGINASKPKTSIEDNHTASVFINHSKKLNVESVVQRFGLLSVPVKAGRELNIGSKRVCSDQNSFRMIRHRSPAENRLNVHRRHRLEWPRAGQTPGYTQIHRT